MDKRTDYANVQRNHVVSGKTWYATANGNPVSSGGNSASRTTLSHALGNAGDQDIVLVTPGT